MLYHHITRLLRPAALLLTVAALGACSDDNEAFDVDPGQDASTDITLTLRLSDFDLQSVSGRAVDENSVTHVTLLGYDNAGEYTSCSTFTGADIVASGNTAKIHATLPKGTVKVAVVANAASLFADGTLPTQALTAMTSNANLSTASNLIFWGESQLFKMLGNDYQIDLLRQTAKVAVKSEASGFEMTGYRLMNTADRGTVAPTMDGANPQFSPAAGAQTNIVAPWNTTAPCYVYETVADAPYVILKGKYSGKEWYYKLGIYTNGTNDRLPLKRNHFYTLTVKKVEGTGYASEADAKNGAFSNNVVAELIDADENIYDIVGTNSYALGVQDMVEVAATTTSIDVAAVQIAKDASTFATGTLTATPSESWITAVNIGNYTQTTPAGQTPRRTYSLQITLSPNTKSTEPREATVIVRWNDLERTVTVRQLGMDFKRDTNRKVSFVNGPATVTDDYFYWLDNTLKGVTPEAMMGAERNQGLHFSTETDCGNYVYRIAKLAGDKSCVAGRSNISVTDQGSYWEVTLTDGGTAATQMWISNVTLTNADGYQIVYPVYRTGVIHHILPAIAETYQVSDDKVDGWFYYETVAVKGSDNKIYYVLDRNIGASGNGPFSLSAAPLASNANTIGAYCKISLTKGDNIKPNLCPMGFTVPTNAELAAIGFTPGTFSTLNGDMFDCSHVAADQTKSKLSVIYLPTGGYVDGSTYRNSNHTDVWSCSYLAGAQGFNEKGLEYQFWFLYYESYGTKSTISSMRFINGSAGQHGSLYRGMPVRCIRGNSETPNIGGTTTNVGGINYITVYWDNTNTNYAAPYIYYYGTTVSTTWPGVAMTLVSGSKYSATVPEGSYIIFSDNGNTSTQVPGTNEAGFKAEAGKTYSGSGSTPTPTSYTVYWNNTSKNWSKVYIYAFDDNETKAFGDWPGKEISNKVNGVYSVTDVPAGYKIIFNNGSSGNGNQYPASGGWTANNGHVYCDYGDLGTYTVNSSYKYAYFYNSSSWSTVKAYGWNGTDNNGWPGVAMTAVSGIDKMYKVQLPASYVNVIFNGGSDTQKTGDLTLTDQKIYKP